jgi:hypothetical protein
VSRNQELEYRFLRRAEEIADKHVGFTTRVLERLEIGESLYHDDWEGRSIEDLLREAREEVVDGPAWLVLAVQRIRRHPDVDAVQRAQLLDWAHQWAACCAQADDLARRMLLVLPEGL